MASKPSWPALTSMPAHAHTPWQPKSVIVDPAGSAAWIAWLVHAGADALDVVVVVAGTTVQTDVPDLVAATSAVLVDGPYWALTVRFSACWNAAIAARVIGPTIPSTAPLKHRTVVRSVWSVLICTGESSEFGWRFGEVAGFVEVDDVLGDAFDPLLPHPATRIANATQTTRTERDEPDRCMAADANGTKYHSRGPMSSDSWRIFAVEARSAAAGDLPHP